MIECHPTATPVDARTKLSATDGSPVANPTLYRSLAGALQYLTLTRPDIAYAIQQVYLFMHDPCEPHLSLLKRILRYVKGTISVGLHLSAGSVDTLIVYSDADWAGCPDSRRSTSGYCVYLGDNLASWSSKRQTIVSRSSAEAEYRAVAHALAETCWLRQLLQELHTLTSATIVYCDNVNTVYMTGNPVHHRCTKHIEIDIHFVRDKVALGQVRVLHVPSSHQFAVIRTKGLPIQLLLSLGPVFASETLLLKLLVGIRDIYIDMYRLTCIVRYVLVLQAYPAIYMKGHPPSLGVQCICPYVTSLHLTSRWWTAQSLAAAMSSTSRTDYLRAIGVNTSSKSIFSLHEPPSDESRLVLHYRVVLVLHLVYPFRSNRSASHRRIDQFPGPIGFN